ncbi:MAG TPA: hypothetical protein VD931_16765 [Baekduia sp.]|nr:hypothetical protein [Baekduia sp.]
MAWDETASEHFTARHESEDAEDVAGVLELLEGTHERLAGVFPSVPQSTTVVVHGSDAALALAEPIVPLVRRMTAPAARRYLVGWPGRTAIHVLAPRLLAARASNVPGSREMELLAPAALYAQVVVGANSGELPPPFRVGSLVRAARWAWLVFGAGQWFSGQTPHARPAIGRRLREGGRPEFPPSLRDAPLLGGTVLDLLAREEGEAAVVRLVTQLPPGGPRGALVHAFHGRPLVHTEGTWRAHLARLAGQPARD